MELRIVIASSITLWVTLGLVASELFRRSYLRFLASKFPDKNLKPDTIDNLIQAAFALFGPFALYVAIRRYRKE